MSFTDELKQFYQKVWTQQLYRDYEQILYQYSLRLPKVTLSIKPSQSFWGRWDPLLREICINARLIQDYSWSVVVEILKHEMAHQWVTDVAGVDDPGHGPDFLKAAETLGIAGWARQATGCIEQPTGPDATEADPLQLRIIARIKKLQALAGSNNENEAFLA